MKIIYVNCGSEELFEGRSLQLYTQLMQLRKEGLKKNIYIYIQLDVHRRSQDSALLAVKERNRPVGELLKS